MDKVEIFGIIAEDSVYVPLKVYLKNYQAKVNREVAVLIFLIVMNREKLVPQIALSSLISVWQLSHNDSLVQDFKRNGNFEDRFFKNLESRSTEIEFTKFRPSILASASVLASALDVHYSEFQQLKGLILEDCSLLDEAQLDQCVNDIMVKCTVEKFKALYSAEGSSKRFIQLSSALNISLSKATLAAMEEEEKKPKNNIADSTSSC
ncbi:hypothetical protein EZV62_024641 [Acer yangbiense]|uniref:Cyclin C-terminal domain-containing protein n=1 Tax=Acer yangbiense TaxID=1000413 RepID=A0A5C7GXF8_9ROSI|nr:hypothetical protein EZV62_024641 [Acer yangbiense]